MTLIPSKIISDFTRKEKISGIAAFLKFLEMKQNIKKFYDFCKRKDIIFAQFPDAVLLHGSSEKIADLAPQEQTKRGEPLLYATSNPNYAIFLAVLKLQDGGASVLVKNGIAHLSIDIDFVNGKSKLSEGYVHVIPKASFRKITNDEYSSTKLTEIIFSILVTPQDLTVPILVQVS